MAFHVPQVLSNFVPKTELSFNSSSSQDSSFSPETLSRFPMGMPAISENPDDCSSVFFSSSVFLLFSLRLINNFLSFCERKTRVANREWTTASDLTSWGESHFFYAKVRHAGYYNNTLCGNLIHACAC